MGPPSGAVAALQWTTTELLPGADAAVGPDGADSVPLEALPLPAPAGDQ